MEHGHKKGDGQLGTHERATLKRVNAPTPNLTWVVGPANNNLNPTHPQAHFFELISNSNQPSIFLFSTLLFFIPKTKNIYIGVVRFNSLDGE